MAALEQRASLRELCFPAIEDRSIALLVGDHLLQFLFSRGTQFKQRFLPLSFELCSFGVGLCGCDRCLSVRYFCFGCVNTGLCIRNVSLCSLDCGVTLCDLGGGGLNSGLRLNDSRVL